MKYKFHYCNEWHTNMSQIIDAQKFCDNQAAGPKYTGSKFKYCPWCGKELHKYQSKTNPHKKGEN